MAIFPHISSLLEKLPASLLQKSPEGSCIKHILNWIYMQVSLKGDIQRSHKVKKGASKFNNLTFQVTFSSNK